MLFAATTCQVNAGFVTFDDLTGDGALISGYGGIDWKDQWSHYDDVQEPYNPSSGTQRIYNALLQQDAAFSFIGGPVTFNGAHVSGFDAVSVRFDMYLGGVLQASSAVLSPTSTPTFLSSGYSGLVDEVRVHGTELSGIYNYYVLDDVSFDSAVAPVPEPASLAVWGIGAFGAMFTARRRRQKNLTA